MPLFTQGVRGQVDGGFADLPSTASCRKRFQPAGPNRFDALNICSQPNPDKRRLDRVVNGARRLSWEGVSSGVDAGPVGGALLPWPHSPWRWPSTPGCPSFAESGGRRGIEDGRRRKRRWWRQQSADRSRWERYGGQRSRELLGGGGGGGGGCIKLINCKEAEERANLNPRHHVHHWWDDLDAALKAIFHGKTTSKPK